MTARNWEKRVLASDGDGERAAEIEQELLLANNLTGLREGAGLSQRQLAIRIGVSQPRVAAIERSHNVTIEVLDQYVRARWFPRGQRRQGPGEDLTVRCSRPGSTSRVGRSSVEIGLTHSVSGVGSVP